MLAAMSETAAGSVHPDGPHQEMRERVTLVAFVVTAVIAMVAWLVLLGWLAIVGLRALGV